MENNGKNQGGRPTEYDEEKLIGKAMKYLESCEDEQYRLVKTEGGPSTTYENRIKVKIPTIEGLSLALDVDPTTLYDWEKKHEKFSQIMNLVRRKQADSLIRKGLSGDYNPTIAKVLLSKHGYREAKDITSDDERINFTMDI